mmetsp:Transcript_2934/g.7611  ORF Transcript_2934/g.7611 Transcript_2934/m.7611 type:complete len:92 (+) Transcript_2934:558-833(+)
MTWVLAAHLSCPSSPRLLVTANVVEQDVALEFLTDILPPKRTGRQWDELAGADSEQLAPEEPPASEPHEPASEQAVDSSLVQTTEQEHGLS